MTSGIEPETRRIEGNANNEEDRISNLPDVIIFHILSFLRTEDAVKTDILSKRWRYLWKNVTSFNFGNSSFEVKIFHYFVDRVLDKCDSKPIQRFRLHTKFVEFYRVKAWIDEAMRRNVSELDLSLSKYPSSVFTCKTLTVLNILHVGKDTEYEIPPSLYLPSLRILVIQGFHPPNNLMEKLIPNCPVLESLELRTNCHEKDSNVIISSPILKRLKFRLYTNSTSNCKLVINTPNLGYVYLYYSYMADYNLENLSSIAKADVDVGRHLWGRFDDETIPNRVVELLRGLRAVKSLTLRYGTMRVLHRAYQHHLHLPIFYSMTRLALINYEEDGRKILPRLLEVSPKLKDLILDKWYMRLGLENPEEDVSSASDWSEPHNVPECMSSHLERVHIKGFKGNGYELKLVEYLLEHSAGLKRLTIRFARLAPETMEQISQKLMGFPKISRSCQVHFSNYLD